MEAFQYTFFDPGFAHLSPGVFSILWQIREAQRRRLPWLYLGYWIPGCRKMEYKGQYRPLQAYQGDRWQELEAGEMPVFKEADTNGGRQGPG